MVSVWPRVKIFTISFSEELREKEGLSFIMSASSPMGHRLQDKMDLQHLDYLFRNQRCKFSALNSHFIFYFFFPAEAKVILLEF